MFGQYILPTIFGFIVTAGEFTADAKKFAKGLNVNLFNGAQLRRMIRDTEKLNSLVGSKKYPESESSSNCPKCGKAMIVKKGTRVGQKFWGEQSIPEM